MHTPVNHLFAQYRNRLLNNQGIAAIEFAILLPIFVMFTLGVIEFGMYFARKEIADSAVSNVTLTLQRNPDYFKLMSPAQQGQVVQSYGSRLVKFSPPGSNSGNYICADAYQKSSQAQAAAPCKSTHFNVKNPNADPTKPYYISVRADLKPNPLTPLGHFVSGLQNIQVQQSSGAISVGQLIPPSCDAPGQVLQFKNGQFSCQTLYPPDCSHPWNKIIYDQTSAQFECENIPYVVTGGVANPRGYPGSSQNWIQDDTYFKERGSYDDMTLCQNGVTFRIPHGLPTGQVVTEGNLVYFLDNGYGYTPGYNGTWHAWAVSFLFLNVPLLGGTATTNICESHGGNWHPNDTWPVVDVERVTWSATYIPANPFVPLSR